MNNLESHIGKAFIISSIYLLSIVLGGFLIIPVVFQIDKYNFPLLIELLIKVTSTIAVVTVLSSAVIIPILRLAISPQKTIKIPGSTAATTLCIGLVLVISHGIYVKLMTCPVQFSNAWYCHVEGKSYVGMVFLALLVASLVGLIEWTIKKVASKRQ